MKIFRLAAYVVLFTLVLSLGDWPFVDEIFAQSAQQSQSMSVDEVAFQEIGKSFEPQHSASADRPAASIYQSLTNLVDMPSHHLVLPVDYVSPTHPATEQAFVSATPHLLDRPPKISLS